MKKILFLPLCALLLAGCNSSSGGYSKQNLKEIQDFISSLQSHNYTAKMSDDYYYFLNDHAFITKFKDQTVEGGYIKKDNAGIFDYVVSNNVLEVQGMISLDSTSSPYDYVSTPEYIARIDSKYWVGDKEKGVAHLDLSKMTSSRNNIAWAFIIENEIVNNNAIKEVTASIGNTVTFKVKYQNKAKKTVSKSFSISNVGTTSNSLVTDYVTSGDFSPKTDWTNYQKQMFTKYELDTPFFFSGYTLGLSLSFSYAESYKILMAYDIMSSKAKEDEFKQELLENHYDITVTPENMIVALKKVESEEGTYGDQIQFKYLSVDEIDPRERKSCPNGYLQVVYNSSLYYDGSTIEAVNSTIGTQNIPPVSDSEMIDKVALSNHTELYNEQYKEAIKEEEPEEDVQNVILGAYIARFTPVSGTSLQDVNTYIKAYLAGLDALGWVDAQKAMNDLIGDTSEIEYPKDFDEINYGRRGKIASDENSVVWLEFYSYDYLEKGYFELNIEIFTKYGVSKLSNF